MSRLHAFLAELKRRRVWRVTVVYAVAALAVVETADLFLPRLALPEWSVTLIVVLAVLGFPIALVLAWAFEVSPEGVRRTEPVAGEAALEPARRRVLFAGAAGVALLAGGGWWLLAAGGGGSAPEIERLAVLPLSNLMNDPEQEYFVQGMHDRLISELQQAGVAVIARTSVMGYGDGRTPARQIARELGVDALIEGSVLRAGDSVTIETRLVDGTTEEYLWRESFGGNLRNVVALHRDLTRAIAEEIHAALGPDQEARLAGARPVDPHAYEAYLKGQFHVDKLTPGDLETALHYFELALEQDRDYALAYVGLARAWGSRIQMGYTPASVAEPKARGAVARAIELDSTLAEAHQLLGAIRTWAEWDWEGGEAEFRRAIALNPNYPDARAVYSHLLLILGRPDEAMVQIDRALELDPLNPFFRAFYAVVLLDTRRYEEAIEQFRNVRRTVPNHPMAFRGLQSAYHLTGRFEDAYEEHLAEARAIGDRELEQALIRGHLDGGYGEAVHRAAETLAARAEAGHARAGRIARLYARVGKTEEALEWLARAYDAHEPSMPYEGVNPILDPLRDDPRFQDLLRRMNLPS